MWVDVGSLCWKRYHRNSDEKKAGEEGTFRVVFYSMIFFVCNKRWRHISHVLCHRDFWNKWMWSWVSCILFSLFLKIPKSYWNERKNCEIAINIHKTTEIFIYSFAVAKDLLPDLWDFVTPPLLLLILIDFKSSFGHSEFI